MLLKVINFSLYHGKYIVYRCVTSSVEFTANTTQLPIFPGLSSKVKDCSGFRGVHRLTLAKDFHHFCFYRIKNLSRSFLVRYLADKPLCAIILILLHQLHIPVISHELVSYLSFVSLQLLSNISKLFPILTQVLSLVSKVFPSFPTVQPYIPPVFPNVSTIFPNISTVQSNLTNLFPSLPKLLSN